MGNRKPTVPNILLSFADLIDAEIKNNRLDIPEKFGSGYCSGFVFNEHIRMLISNYKLKEELVVTNPDINTAGRMIFFKFQNIFSKTEPISKEEDLKQAPSVLIATSRLNTDEVISIHSNTATINIEVDANYLGGRFDLAESSPLLQSLLLNNRPLLFDQLIYPSLQKIVDEIVTEQVSKSFELYFLGIKAEELICRLLMEFEMRQEKYVYPLNSQDIQIIYNMRAQMLEHLKTPPVISELAVRAGMSPTKLKRLFGQIFGDSIFSYYQKFRMKEAARLLREENMSVSDAGYRLGFTNLSHFSRVFGRQMGIKPKKYSAM